MVGLGERSLQLQAPNSFNSTLPPWRSWLGAGSRTFLYSLLLLAHLRKPHPSSSRTAYRSQALKSTSGGRGVGGGAGQAAANLYQLPTPFSQTWPLSIQEARATSAAATGANCWSEERQSCAKAPGSTLYTCDLSEKLPKLCETDMVSSPSIHEHLKSQTLAQELSRRSMNETVMDPSGFSHALPEPGLFQTTCPNLTTLGNANFSSAGPRSWLAAGRGVVG